MSQAVQQILEAAERLYRDLALDAVRQWKATTGGLAVGFLPIWAPRELLHAQGVLPVGIMGGGEDVEIIRGDAFYQSYICHLPRSVVELGLGGQLDALDGMLFPAICDVIRNLSGVWQMRFPDKLVRYLDVPQDFDPAIGGVFLRAELESLAHDLQARGARPLDPESLRASIAAYNRNRRLVGDLYALRERAPWKVPTAELYLILRAGLVLPVEAFDDLLLAYRAAVEEDEGRRPLDQARVLLVGSFCEQPPIGLIKTIERAGCYIVDDDFVQVHRFFRHDVALAGDPMQNLVDAFLHDAVESPTRYSAAGEKDRALAERVRACRAEGVVFCAPSFCDPALLDQPMATRAVEAAGVSWTAFKYAENSGQFQVIREQAGTFADSIKLWSGATA
jgi:benzoyl-CoA reductase subunit C